MRLAGWFQFAVVEGYWLCISMVGGQLVLLVASEAHHSHRFSPISELPLEEFGTLSGFHRRNARSNAMDNGTFGQYCITDTVEFLG